MSELLSCPFCGAEPELLDGGSVTAIRCSNDQCITRPEPFNDWGHRGSAIAAWNRRAPAQPEPAAPTLTTCNCRWDGETQVQQCTLHEAHVQAIHEWAERARAAESKAAPTVVEPDWDDIREQAEEATGLKVERHTYSIVIREVRKWLAATPPRAALTEFQRMQIIGDEFPLPLVDPLVIAKVDAVCRAIEAAHGIGGPRNE